jgi:quercetin dioxygenase-like cupin family protein
MCDTIRGEEAAPMISDELRDRLKGSDPSIVELYVLAEKVLESRPGVVTYASVSGRRFQGNALFEVAQDPDDPLQPGGAGQLAYMAQGDVMDLHAHYGCTEILAVICGVLDVRVTGRPDVVRLVPGDVRRLPPGELHAAEAVTNCWVVGITVPRDGGYPSVSTDAAADATGRADGAGPPDAG